MSQLKESLVSLPSLAAKTLSLTTSEPLSPGRCGATGQLLTEVGQWIGAEETGVTGHLEI